jgi:MarR family
MMVALMGQLTALRNAIDVVLSWPDSIRSEIARWLSPDASKPGNGRDPHPLRIAPISRPHSAKARRNSPFNMKKTAEIRLLEALRETPGLSVAALAKAAGSSRSVAGERLRQLAARGAVEKDPDGHWRLVGQEPRPTAPGEHPDPTSPSPATS